jgi:hypothetical protein
VHIKGKIDFITSTVKNAESLCVAQVWHTLKTRLSMVEYCKLGRVQGAETQTLTKLVDKNREKAARAFNHLIAFSGYKLEETNTKTKYICNMLIQKKALDLVHAYNGLKTRASVAKGMSLGSEKTQGVKFIRKLIEKLSNKRLLCWNKLLTATLFKKLCQRTKMNFIIQTLKDKNSMFILQAYNGLKIRPNVLRGIGVERANFNEIKFVRRLVDKSYDRLWLAWNKLIEEYKVQSKYEATKMRFIIQTLRDGASLSVLQAYNGLKLNRNLLLGIGLGKSKTDRTKCVSALADKSNEKLWMAFNRLTQFKNLQQYLFDNKMRFVIQAIKHKNSHKLLQAYNGLKFRPNIYKGIGLGKAQFNEVKFVRRLLEKNYDKLWLAWNKLLEEYRTKKSNERTKTKFILQALFNQKSKFILQAYNGLKVRPNILKGIGIGKAKYTEIKLVKSVVEKADTLRWLAWGKLVEVASRSKGYESTKMRFIVKTLRDKEAMWILQAYNGLKVRPNVLKGIGLTVEKFSEVKCVKKVVEKSDARMLLAFGRLRNHAGFLGERISWDE